ncbi:MAG TPA: hypothetical protein VN783_07255 [Thermoanaerobaculia bacterium]|nr:hypothetical protein [Thermoanaerobaculia bacterium]
MPSLSRSRPWLGAVLALGLVATACSEESPTAPATSTILFSYAAAPAGTPPASYPSGCIRSVIRTHVSVSWKEPRVSMSEQSEGRFEVQISGAPVGRELSVAVADPNACFRNPTGRATSGVYANGVRLTRFVSAGPEGPRFLFRVAADGSVTP